MRIQSINNKPCHNFGALVYNKSALDKLPQSVVKDIPQVEKDLANTKHWDLVLNSDTYNGELNWEYVNKHDSNLIYSYGLKEPCTKDKTISTVGTYIYKNDNKWVGDYISFVDLNFKTNKQVSKALNTIKSYNSDSLISEAKIVKVLDSAEEIVLDDETHLIQNLA